ncbi:MAG TPA: hypothetical protein VMM79_09525 [Longimicrobiales bacterium]|nr:hypothetical protein [Longimicrobiales bacterium]
MTAPSVPLVARDVLKTVGFNAVEITRALKDEFRIAGLDMYDALKGAATRPLRSAMLSIATASASK